MTTTQKTAYQEAAAERKRKSRALQRQKRAESVAASTDDIVTPNSSRQKRAESVAASPDDIVTPNSSAIPYVRPQSLGKAVRKSVRLLPYSPTKQKLVVAGLAKYVGLQIKDVTERNLHGENQRGNQGLPDNTVSLIKEFFYRPDIVYTAPGMRDEMTVWENGVKSKLRKHFLTMFMREAFALFKEFNPDVSVSFSKFCSLRPPNVLLLENSPVDQCKCRHHENFRLKMKSLGVEYDQSWWQKVLCTSGDLLSQCWKSECETCKAGKLFLKPDEQSQTKIVTYLEWKKDFNERLTKIAESGSMSSLYQLVMDELPMFQEHVRIKRIQSESFEQDKMNCRVLQVDFAMAYSCEYQNEIQSALWARDSVTLFTGAVFFEGTCKTYLICSDTRDKGKSTVYAFMMYLYQNMPQQPGNIQEVIFTDGPSSEFKNRFCMKLLRDITLKLKKDVTWKYFATSHGKGVVDGIGGKAKSLVRQKVMSKSEITIVKDSVSFAKVAAELMPATHVVHISQKEIDDMVNTVNPWSDVPAMQGIHRVHVAACSYPSGHLQLFRSTGESTPITTHLGLSQIPGTTTISSEEQSALNLIVGDWCIVLYDGEEFPGVVTTIVQDDVEI